MTLVTYGLRRHTYSERTVFLSRRRCTNRLLPMANPGAAVSGSKAILQQLKMRYRPRMTNFWHACPKWHAEIFPWHEAFTTLRFFFFNFLCPTGVSILWIICLYIHTSHCVEIQYALPLLPNSTASEEFLHKSGAVGSADWIFIVEAPSWRWRRDIGQHVVQSSSFQTGRSCGPI